MNNKFMCLNIKNNASNSIFLFHGATSKAKFSVALIEPTQLAACNKKATNSIAKACLSNHNLEKRK